MRHAVLAATLAFGHTLRPRGVVPVASRRVGKMVLNWLDRRRRVSDDAHDPDESELWSPSNDMQ